MDAPIAPRAMSAPDEGPVYDLIALGLVTFVILLTGVWVTHWFRQPPPGPEQFQKFLMTLDLHTSRDRLRAAKWADMHFRGEGAGQISMDFRDHLKAALRLEAAERAHLEREASESNPDIAVRAEARARLGADPVPPVQAYTRRWIRDRSAWIAALDADRFRVSAQMELFQFLRNDLGMQEEADRELEILSRSRPDLAKELQERADQVRVRTVDPGTGGRLPR